MLTPTNSGTTWSFIVGNLLRGPKQIWRGQHLVQILGSASHTLKYNMSSCTQAIAEMSNFIEVDGYIILQFGVASWGGPGNF